MKVIFIMVIAIMGSLNGQRVYSQSTAWVLWAYEEVSSLKGDASRWSAEDAFEDLSSCKKAAKKSGELITKATNNELVELNAGYWFLKDTGTKENPRRIQYKWLCLPGGTNPGIVLRPSSNKY